MRIALVGVLPPLRSGIADHTVELARALGTRNEVQLYVEDAGGVATPAGLREARAASDLPRRRHEHDVVLYQVGNHAAHGFVYELAREVRGVLDLHDATLHDLVASRYLGRPLAFARELARNEGLVRMLPRLLAFDPETRIGAARWLDRVRFRVSAHADRRALFPLRHALIRAARAVVVHSVHLEQSLRLECPRTPVVHVPHGVRDDLPPQDRRAARAELGLARLGVGDETTVALSFGLIQAHKRIAVALDAVRRARAGGLDLHYVLVGPRSPDLELDAAIAARDLAAAVHVVDDFPPIERVALWICAADLGLNLRGPSSGGTSGALLKMMALGLPTIVTAVPELTHLPPDSVHFVATGAREAHDVALAIERWARSPEQRDRVAARARAAIRDGGFGWPVCAERYQRALAAVVEGERVSSFHGS